jgi:hypothetical protein
MVTKKLRFSCSAAFIFSLFHCVEAGAIPLSMGISPDAVFYFSEETQVGIHVDTKTIPSNLPFRRHHLVQVLRTLDQNNVEVRELPQYQFKGNAQVYVVPFITLQPRVSSYEIPGQPTVWLPGRRIEFKSDLGVKPMTFTGTVQTLFKDGTAQIRWDKQKSQKSIDEFWNLNLLNDLIDTSSKRNTNLTNSSDAHLALTAEERGLHNPFPEYLGALQEKADLRASLICQAWGYQGISDSPRMIDAPKDSHHSGSSFVQDLISGEFIWSSSPIASSWSFSIEHRKMKNFQIGSGIYIPIISRLGLMFFPNIGIPVGGVLGRITRSSIDAEHAHRRIQESKPMIDQTRHWGGIKVMPKIFSEISCY